MEAETCTSVVVDRVDAASKGQHKRAYGWMVLGAIVALAVSIQAWVTWNGIGLSPDSVSYLQISQSLERGDGYGIRALTGETYPLLHWPPLLPMVLVACLRLGVSAVDGAFWIGGVLVGVNVGLVACLARRVGNQSWSAAIIAALVMTLSIELLAIHAMLASEPLFLALVLAGVLLLEQSLRSHRLPLLAAASVCMGLAWITRYAGVGVIAAGAIGLLIYWRPRGTVRRWTGIALFTGLAVMPMVVWIAWGFAQTQLVANRSFSWHPPSAPQMQSLYATAARWLVAVDVDAGRTAWVALAQLVLVGIAYGRIRLSPSFSAKSRRIANLLLIAMLVYFSLLMLSVSCFDAYTPLDSRTLLPLQALATPLVCGAFVPAITRGSGTSRTRLIFASITILVIAMRVPTTFSWVRTARSESLGYNSIAWRESSIMRSVRGLPEDALIYSNRMDAVYACTGRVCRQLPRRFDPTRERANPKLARHLEQIRQQIRRRQAYVVLVKRRGLEYLSGEEELRRIGQLRLVRRYRQGTIYLLSDGAVGSSTSGAGAERWLR